MTSRSTAAGVITGTNADLVEAAGKAIDALVGIPRQRGAARVGDLVAALTLDLDKDFFAVA